ncbi:MAG TPA: electron transfer flavoprotein subunit alpha/FixB family protein, partial [Oceanospirillales bacterium]|nr:electron transfer flavoprotein subunit alpha/FixB family protein [Oceanospirillales bacterium]
MSKILILAQHDGKTINQGTSKAVTAASQISGAEIDLIIFADDTSTIATEASKLANVNTIHAFTSTNENWKLAQG